MTWFYISFTLSCLRCFSSWWDHRFRVWLGSENVWSRMILRSLLILSFGLTVPHSSCETCPCYSSALHCSRREFHLYGWLSMKMGKYFVKFLTVKSYVSKCTWSELPTVPPRCGWAALEVHRHRRRLVAGAALASVHLFHDTRLASGSRAVVHARLSPYCVFTLSPETTLYKLLDSNSCLSPVTNKFWKK